MGPAVRQSPIYLSAFLLSLVTTLPATGQQPEPNRHALLIAVTTYRHAEMNKPRLAYPEIDAKDIGAFLANHGYEVEYLLGKKATKKAIEEKLEGLADKGNQPGVVLVGLWGHGVEFDGSDEAMFCPFDAKIRYARDSQGNPLYAEGSRKRLIEPNPTSLVGMSEVLGGLRLCGAGNRLLIADCCRVSPNRPRGRAFGSNVKLTDLPDNMAAIFACKADEQAFEDKRWGHGAFSKALLELLPHMVAREDTTVTSILGPLKRNVARLVRDASNGRDTQTIHPIFNGLPDLRLESASGPELVKNRFGMEFRLIPAGEFMMGSGKSAEEIARIFDTPGSFLESEHPHHRVRISRSFYLQTTEVTQKQWQSVMGTEPWKNKTGVKEGADYPATFVTWTDAVAFCRKLSEREGVSYRLPTEAEWEYACRAGRQSMYSFGDDVSELDKFGWYDWNADDIGEDYAHRVGQKRANDWGLYDMHGNVREWCADWYGKDYYASAPTSDPQGPSRGSRRVERGGSWYYSAGHCRSAFRYWYAPARRNSLLGFRLARSSVK